MPYKDLEKKRENDACNQRRRSNLARISCIELLGNECSRCGTKDQRLLCIDHVNGGGKKEIKKSGGYYFRKTFKKLLSNSTLINTEYQLLCFNCNHLKRLIRSESSKRKYL